MKKFGILGVGKMGGSILQGILSSGLYKKEDILLCVRNQTQKDQLVSEGYQVTSDYPYFFNNVKVIMLSIKPQGFKDMMEIANQFDYSSRCVISIAAGITIKYLEANFKNASIVRVMPNTPSLIKMGVSTICSSKKDEYLDLTVKIFSSIGKAYVVDESQMDSTLPLNGSMPAYLFYFAKCFIDAAVKQGVDYQKAKELAVETMISSCNLILNSSDDLDTLINNVCSKGGTTIAGLDKLRDNEIDKAIEECFNACMNRSKELSK